MPCLTKPQHHLPPTCPGNDLQAQINDLESKIGIKIQYPKIVKELKKINTDYGAYLVNKNNDRFYDPQGKQLNLLAFRLKTLVQKFETQKKNKEVNEIIALKKMADELAGEYSKDLLETVVRRYSIFTSNAQPRRDFMESKLDEEFYVLAEQIIEKINKL